MVPAQGAPVPWWYAKELQGVRKLVEQQAQTMKNTEVELRGLQGRITQTTHNLTERVEVLEAARLPVAVGNEAPSLDLDAVTVSITSLESRFERFRDHTASRMEDLLALYEKNRWQAGSQAPGSMDDLQMSLSDYSNHIMRHSASAKRLSTCITPKTPKFGSVVLPTLPCHKESAALQNSSECDAAHERVIELLSAKATSFRGNSSLAIDAWSTDTDSSVDTNLHSASSFSASSSKRSGCEDSTALSLHAVLSHMIQQIVGDEQSVSNPQSKDHFQLVVACNRGPS